eukprot:12155553-Prorocentrum_lima.AAC.1
MWPGFLPVLGMVTFPLRGQGTCGSRPKRAVRRLPREDALGQGIFGSRPRRAGEPPPSKTRGQGICGSRPRRADGPPPR